jgi:hypothetical protein
MRHYYRAVDFGDPLAWLALESTEPVSDEAFLDWQGVLLVYAYSILVAYREVRDNLKWSISRTIDCHAPLWEGKGERKLRNIYVRYSILLHLPPLRFHCVGGCWDRTQDSWGDYGIGCQTL